MPGPEYKKEEHGLAQPCSSRVGSAGAGSQGKPPTRPLRIWRRFFAVSLHLLRTPRKSILRWQFERARGV